MITRRQFLGATGALALSASAVGWTSQRRPMIFIEVPAPGYLFLSDVFQKAMAANGVPMVMLPSTLDRICASCNRREPGGRWERMAPFNLSKESLSGLVRGYETVAVYATTAPKTIEHTASVTPLVLEAAKASGARVVAVVRLERNLSRAKRALANSTVAEITARADHVVTVPALGNPPMDELAEWMHQSDQQLFRKLAAATGLRYFEQPLET